MKSTARVVAVVAASVWSATCGGNPSSPDPTDVVIEIRATGPSPREVTVARGGRVTFTNTDVRQHAVSSDPVQTHTDCPAVNDVGTVNPGQSRSTGVLDVARICGFHDHNNEDDPTFKGRILVQ